MLEVRRGSTLLYSAVEAKSPRSRMGVAVIFLFSSCSLRPSVSLHGVVSLEVFIRIRLQELDPGDWRVCCAGQQCDIAASHGDLDGDCPQSSFS